MVLWSFGPRALGHGLEQLIRLGQPSIGVSDIGLKLRKCKATFKKELWLWSLVGPRALGALPPALSLVCQSPTLALGYVSLKIQFRRSFGCDVVVIWPTRAWTWS